MDAAQARSMSMRDCHDVTAKQFEFDFTWDEDTELPPNAYHNPKVFNSAVLFLNTVKARFGDGSQEDVECHDVLMRWRAQELSNEQLRWQMVKLFQDHSDLREAFEKFYYATISKNHSISPRPTSDTSTTQDSPTMDARPVPLQVPFTPNIPSLWTPGRVATTPPSTIYTQMRDVAYGNPFGPYPGPVPSIYQSGPISVYRPAAPPTPFRRYSVLSPLSTTEFNGPHNSPSRNGSWPQHQVTSIDQNLTRPQAEGPYTAVVINLEPDTTATDMWSALWQVGARVLRTRIVKHDFPVAAEVDFADEDDAQEFIANFDNRMLSGRLLSVYLKTMPFHDQSPIQMKRPSPSTNDPKSKRVILASNATPINDNVKEEEIHTSIEQSTLDSKATSQQRNMDRMGPFVHAICGARFQHKASVKKHHFGKAIPGETETSGCWYKNGKPDIAWDADSSCRVQKDTPHAPGRSSARRLSAATNVSEDTVNADATNLSRANVIMSLPDLPKLTGLPARVAPTVSRGSYSDTPVPLPENVRDLQQQATSQTPTAIKENLHKPAGLTSEVPKAAVLLDERTSLAPHLEKQADMFNEPSSDEMDLVGDKPTSALDMFTSINSHSYLNVTQEDTGGNTEAAFTVTANVDLPHLNDSMAKPTRSKQKSITTTADSQIIAGPCAHETITPADIRVSKQGKRKRGHKEVGMNELKTLSFDSEVSKTQDRELSAEEMRKVGLGLRSRR